MNTNTKCNYIIAIDGGEKYYLIGNNLVYTEYIREAITFPDFFSALLYIEKHGLEKLDRIVLKPTI